MKYSWHGLLITSASWRVHINAIDCNPKKKTRQGRDTQHKPMAWLPRVRQQWPWVLKVSAVLLFERAKMTAAQQRAGALVVALWSSGFYMSLWRERLGERKKNRQSVKVKNKSRTQNLICCEKKCHCPDMPSGISSVNAIDRQSGAGTWCYIGPWYKVHRC